MSIEGVMATEVKVLSGGNERRYNRVVWVLAIGLILLVSHNDAQPFLQYILLPQIGMAMVIGATLLLLIDNWKNLNKESLGPKVIWIPLAVIAGSGVARLVVQPDMHTLAGALFMASMFGLYIISRQYGEKALALFMPAVVVVATSVIVFEIFGDPIKNGGLFFANYTVAVEFLLFGFIVSPKRHQWWLLVPVLIALFFTGAEEGLFCCAILGVMLLIRRDWSKKLLISVGILTLIIVASTSLGITQRLYTRAWAMIQQTEVVATESLTEVEQDRLLYSATNARWSGNWTLSPIRPLGYGLKITELHMGTQHNTVLLIIEQIGPIAAGAWIVLIIMGLVKTKWKYAFMVMALIGVWQPLSWTQTAPYLWVLAGAATSSQVKDDLIFRRKDDTREKLGEVIENHINEVKEVKEGVS